MCDDDAPRELSVRASPSPVPSDSCSRAIAGDRHESAHGDTIWADFDQKGVGWRFAP